jgi:hypothetical protein
VAGLALGGCGNVSNNPVDNGNRMTAEARLTAISASMNVALSSDPSSLPQLTNDYIAAVRSSLGLLGADEAKQKLAETAAQVGPYCSSCAQSLNAEAAAVGS